MFIIANFWCDPYYEPIIVVHDKACSHMHEMRYPYASQSASSCKLLARCVRVVCKMLASTTCTLITLQLSCTMCSHLRTAVSDWSRAFYSLVLHAYWQNFMRGSCKFINNICFMVARRIDITMCTMLRNLWKLIKCGHVYDLVDNAICLWLTTSLLERTKTLAFWVSYLVRHLIKDYT